MRPRRGAAWGAAPGLAAALVATAVAAQDAPGEPPAPLLGYCAPPVVPACLDGLKAHPDTLGACAPLAEAYERSVFAYRVCLTRETERAVQEANAAMAKLRCAQGRRAC